MRYCVKFFLKTSEINYYNTLNLKKKKKSIN